MGRSDAMQTFAVIAAIMILIGAFAAGWLDTLGLDSSINTTLPRILPGLFFCTVAFIWIARGALSSALGCVGGFGVLGVGFAVLLNELYTNSIIDADMISGATIAQIQTLSIVVGIIMGGVAAASRTR